MHSFTLITSLDELNKLSKEWRQLLKESIHDCFFLSHRWTVCWWESFADKTDQLAVVIARKEESIVAIAPFMLCRYRSYGLTFPVLRFIGVPNADHGGILIQKNSLDILPPLINYLQNNIPGWSQIRLSEIPKDGVTALWDRHARPILWTIAESASTCPYIPLYRWDTWEEYYKNLSKKTRMELNRKNNKLKKEGKSRYIHRLNPSPTDQLFLDARSLEAQSAKALQLPTEYLVLVDEQHWDFQQSLCETGATHKVLLSGLYRKDKLISYLFGYIYKNKYYAYNTAYLKEAGKFSPGTLIINETIRYCKSHDIDYFDFLRGSTRLKQAWAKDSAQQINLYLLKKNPKNFFYKNIEFKAKPLIKYILKR